MLVSHVHAHRAHVRFIAREWFSGVAALRRSIHHELEVIVSELADNLATSPVTEAWNGGDRTLPTELVVNQMVVAAERIVDSPDDEPPGSPGPSGS